MTRLRQSDAAIASRADLKWVWRDKLIIDGLRRSAEADTRAVARMEKAK